MLMASWSVTNLPGIEHMLASLCCRANLAISGIQHKADLIPGYLFAVMLIPCPVPQKVIPTEYSPLLMACAILCPKSG